MEPITHDEGPITAIAMGHVFLSEAPHTVLGTQHGRLKVIGPDHQSTLEGRGAAITDLALFNGESGVDIIAGTTSGDVLLFHNGTAIGRVEEEHGISAVSISCDCTGNRSIIVSCLDGRVSSWTPLLNSLNWRVVVSDGTLRHLPLCSGMLYGQSVVVVCCPDAVRILSSVSGELLHTLTLPRMLCACVVDDFIALGSIDGNIYRMQGDQVSVWVQCGAPVLCVCACGQGIAVGGEWNGILLVSGDTKHIVDNVSGWIVSIACHEKLICSNVNGIVYNVHF